MVGVDGVLVEEPALDGGEFDAAGDLGRCRRGGLCRGGDDGGEGGDGLVQEEEAGGEVESGLAGS
ncbi:hypothetical protein ABTX60_31890, partial [Streptomyces sp. NPDC126510]|uniref:hypothetical protein n=1 Tax=Streptomyces sp. NPDC126510 TaxID=3155317 RepID=UPI00331B9CAC